VRFFSRNSITANLRSICGFERGAPVLSTQHLPAGTPQVGQGMENNRWCVSSFFFIPTEGADIQPRNLSSWTPSGFSRETMNHSFDCSPGRYPSVHTAFHRKSCSCRAVSEGCARSRRRRRFARFSPLGSRGLAVGPKKLVGLTTSLLRSH
jgi:hypothetical protein